MLKKLKVIYADITEKIEHRKDFNNFITKSKELYANEVERKREEYSVSGYIEFLQRIQKK